MFIGEGGLERSTFGIPNDGKNLPECILYRGILIKNEESCWD